MNNIIDSIQLSGTVYTLSAQTGGGGVPESAFTAYTAATDERISQDEEVTAAALNELNEAISSGSVTVDMAFDSGSTNPVANSVITPAVTKHYEGQLPAEYTGGYSGGTYVGGFSAETYEEAASYVIRNTTYITRMYKDGIRLKFIDSGNTETQVFACSASTYYNKVYNPPSSYANITIDTVGKNIEITPINNYRLSYVCFYGYYDNSLTTNITNKFSATSYQSFDKTAIQLIDEKQDKLPISAGTGTNSIIENNVNNTASGQNSHAEGYWTVASGSRSHAEGGGTSATSTSSHAEGSSTLASGYESHAEGNSTTAGGNYSHAEGYWTAASGGSSHAEGYRTKANGGYSHADGSYTEANGMASHAEGYWTTAATDYSHTEGQYTITTNQSEHASGQYNVSSSGSSTWGDSGNTLFSVGNGDWSARHNAFEIRQNGDIYLSSGGTDIKLQDHLGGGSITVDTALDSGSTNPVENRVIYNKIDEVEEVTAAALNELNDAISGKVDTSTYNTYTAATDTALNGKQATLVSGTNIKTINNESILGSGNIDIQGGGGTVESAITSGSTNAVESKAIWSATTFNKGVLLTFNGYNQSTNYPEGCGKLVVGNIGNHSSGDIYFINDERLHLGVIHINNFDNISVDTSRFEGATATVDGNIVTIIYPSTGITSIEVINTNWTYTAVVEGALVNENTYMKLEVDGIVNGLQNNINSKLDATAYTPTVVDSALYAGSQNPVKNQALYSELRIDNGETETTLAFENRYSTNYPNGCTKLNVEVAGSNNNSNIEFHNDNRRLGNIDVNNWGGISVNVHFDGASYEISGTTVIITYPTVTSVTKIRVNNDGNYVFKAIVANATPLIDQVAANTIALGAVESRIAEDEEVTAAALNELNDNFGGLKLVKLSQAEYNALATKDASTLYIILD